jgi:cell division protein FtsB
MTIPAKPPPTHWSPVTISCDDDCERLDRALEELEKEDQWINSFIKRLNYTIEEIARKS